MHLRFTPTPGDLEVLAIFQAEGVTINGQFYLWENAPDVVEYGEESGANVVCSGSDHTYSIEPSAWVNPNPPPEPDPVAVAQAALEAWRANEYVKSWQIIAELGGTAWGAIQAYAARPEADHVTRTLINYPPAEIPRASDFVGRLAALLQMDDLAVDDLFRRAKLRKE